MGVNCKLECISQVNHRGTGSYLNLIMGLLHYQGQKCVTAQNASIYLPTSAFIVVVFSVCSMTALPLSHFVCHHVIFLLYFQSFTQHTLVPHSYANILI